MSPPLSPPRSSIPSVRPSRTALVRTERRNAARTGQGAFFSFRTKAIHTSHRPATWRDHQKNISGGCASLYGASVRDLIVRVLKRILAFQNNQRLFGYRPTPELLSCALRPCRPKGARQSPQRAEDRTTEGNSAFRVALCGPLDLRSEAEVRSARRPIHRRRFRTKVTVSGTSLKTTSRRDNIR